VVDPFWGGGKEELTGRMRSTARCGRSEGNGGGGGVRGWWSTAHGVGRLYTAARCSGHGRICRREGGAGCPRRLSGSGNGGAVGGERKRRKKGCSTVEVGALYSRQRRWTTVVWRRGNGGRRNGGAEAIGAGKVAVADV
jgi:hypothetical protein